jgi:hypothetical protein
MVDNEVNLMPLFNVVGGEGIVVLANLELVCYDMLVLGVDALQNLDSLF